MKITTVPVSILLIAGLSSVPLLASSAAATQPGQAGQITPRPFPSSFAGDLPYDVNTAQVGKLLAAGGAGPQTAGVLAAQREFDILAWQAFLALNWPVKADANPPKGTPITSPIGQPRWSFWRPSPSIFLPDGAQPAPWNAAVAGQALNQGTFTLKKTKAAWRQHAAAEDNFEAFSGPLVDQNGKWVRYEALVNHEEFDYIRSNELYSIDGQIRFSQAGKLVGFPVNAGNLRHGAIEIKLAWKEMGPNDDPRRFYTARVKVKVSEAGHENGDAQYRTITAGLVGMHISMRTQSSPQWIWSTFEQIDNVRQNPIDPAHPQGALSHANFMNPALKDAPVNLLPPMNAPQSAGKGNYTTWYESLTTTPVQVARIALPTQPGLNDLDAQMAAAAAALNTQVQALLRKQGSVFQYYELIGTQWPLNPKAMAFPGGDDSAPESIKHKVPGNMVPTFLVNTTMETYFQKDSQAAGPLEQDDRLPAGSVLDPTIVRGTESCSGCHFSAGIALGYKKAADGSRLLVDGKPIPIFGQNSHFGHVGDADFSWMLQLEAQAPNDTPANKIPPGNKLPIKVNVQP